MFPGQPISHDANFSFDADFTGIAALTRERASLDLSTFAWRGEARTKQVALQVYGVAMSLYRNRRLESYHGKPDVIAEHSMGIYAALAASGSISEGDALEMAFRAGDVMERRFRKGEYAFGCVVGMDAGKALSLAVEGAVFPANHNTSHHVLLAGGRREMETTLDEALRRGAFSANLFPCDAPLHTPLMLEAEKELTSVFRDYSYRNPAIPLMNHIDQGFLTADRISDFLMRELIETVQWERTYLGLKAYGVTRFVEVGAGDALKKFNRWIESRL